MSKSLCATLTAIVGQNEHILYVKQIEASYPVTAKRNMSINDKIAKAVTSQSLMPNLKHLSADYGRCDGLYAAVVDMNTNCRQ